MLSNGGVEVPINREEVRERLRRMTDEQLREYGRACVHMCSPQANLGKPPREAFVVQLEEAKVEYRQNIGLSEPPVLAKAESWNSFDATLTGPVVDPAFEDPEELAHLFNRQQCRRCRKLILRTHW